MGAFEIIFWLSALLCGLVAGFVFAFAVVVMPGIRTLGDREFLRSFGIMDRVIQQNNPLFILVWLGSALSTIALLVVGGSQLAGSDRGLALAAGLCFLFGVHLPTIAINIPLNNALQKLDLDSSSDAELREFRQSFEAKWNRWNRIRTGFAILSTAMLIMVAVRLG